MKLNCGLIGKEKEEENKKFKEWHDHFAWWPRRVGRKDCRWLETVQRRFTHVDYDGKLWWPEYREIVNVNV